MRRIDRAEPMPTWARLVVCGMVVAALELLVSSSYVVLNYWGDLVGFDHAPIISPSFDSTPLATWVCVRALVYVLVIVVLWRRIRPAMRDDPRTPTVVRLLLAACPLGLIVNMFVLFFLGIVGLPSLVWLRHTAVALNMVLLGLAIFTKPLTVWRPTWFADR